MRADKDYDAFKDYHFIEIQTGKNYQDIKDTDHEKRDSVTVLKKYPELLIDPLTPRTVKMAALKYLINVIGDIYQPLHVGNSFDMGGNLCRVQLLNLHSVWDSQLIDLDMTQLKSKTSPLKNYGFINYADDIIKKNSPTLEVIKEIQSANYFDWIKESQNLRSIVYPDELPADEESSRVYCQSFSPPAVDPLLTDDYKKKAIEVVELRLLKGGIRLAGLLYKIFEIGSNSGPEVSLDKKQILGKLNLTNF